MANIIDLTKLWGSRDDNAPSKATIQTFPGLVAADLVRNAMVSVVIVGYGPLKALTALLESVQKQNFVREIIIVRAGLDKTAQTELVDQLSSVPKCHIVNGNPNKGLAAAYNLGAQYCSGRFLLFLDSTCVLPEEAVAKLLATGIAKPLPWILGITAGAHSTKSKMSWRGLFRSSAPAKDSKIFPEVSLPGGGFHAASLSGECLFLPYKTFAELKGLDKRCFHSTFHLDFCLRVHLAGGGVYTTKDLNLVPNLSWAAQGQEVKNPFKQKWQRVVRWWQGVRGVVYFYRKHALANQHSQC